MKYIKTMTLAAGLAMAAVSSRADITLNFANVQGAVIEFTGGGNFDFSPTAGPNFSITSSSGVGDSDGNKGTIGGTFHISGGNVTGAGTLTISDGSQNLTADLVWDTISQSGTGGNLNINGQLNLTNVKYTGSESDLQALAAFGLGTQTVAFAFKSTHTLTDLVNGNLSTSFGGQISSAVPEPTTVVAGALLLLPFGLSAVRILRKKNAETMA